MIRIATFSQDITPPIGHPLCAGWYPPAKAISEPLYAIGLVLVAEEMSPMVLCTLDWAELSNGDYIRWQTKLALAVGTSPDHVAVHCTHAHDTPWPDRDAQNILDAYGWPNVIMAGDWAERACEATSKAATMAMVDLKPCTHFSTGDSCVDRIASNRRLVGTDGKIWAMRWTRTTDPMVRAAPEGVIDSLLKTIGFWHNSEPLAVVHYYAVHPTSIDGTGVVNPEFVGMARNQRSAESGVPHLYFTGCAGNVAAGKYNDGTADNRELFARRIYNAMHAAEQSGQLQPLRALRWVSEPVLLPPRPDMDEEDLLSKIHSHTDKTDGKNLSRMALMLTYLRRREQPIHVTCLHLNAMTAILHLPGEAFIEYQLHAQEVRRDAFVAVASYGDLGTGYITLEQSFHEGGYEPTDSFVSGESEQILRSAIDRVMRPKESI